MSEQCEGCLGYKDNAEKFAVLCEECQEKAASYDITAKERKELADAIQKVLPTLRENESLTPYEIGFIFGTLKAALVNCRFKFEETEEAIKK